jgi:DinB family protein
MKHRFALAITLAALALPLVAQDAKPTANPVSAAIKQQLERRSKIMLAAADLMPADKYSFKPTADQMTYGHLILHTAIANGKVCSAITGAAAPTIDVKDTDPKEKLVQAFKESFDFCSAQLANVDDSKLGEEVSLFGGKATRARALIELPIDWADHYSAQAMYLRLNGILPPTAQAKK